MRLSDDSRRILDITEQDAADMETFGRLVLEGAATSSMPVYDLYLRWRCKIGGSLYHFCAMAYVSMAESRANQVRQRQVTVPDPVFKIGLDIGGVLSKYPDILKPLLHVLAGVSGIEVHIVTDMPREKALDMLAMNNVDHPPDRIHSGDYTTHGASCKAILARDLGLHMILDDHLDYVCTPGKPTMRLLVMPDNTRPYYHPMWKTPENSGNFGRVVSPEISSL